MSFKYQIALIGQFKSYKAKLTRILFKHLDELGIEQSHISIITESKLGKTDSKAPLIAVFFGYDGADDRSHPCIASLLNDSIIIIPCVDNLLKVSSKIPSGIRHINVLPLDEGEISIERLATLVLENLRLLRSERRLFISYKRSESQSIAMQLYESFDKAGFDVFLDIRSVPYAVDFQSILWHRMADSDIVVLLDSPEFRRSFWTQQELSRANTTSIQILHLLWPKVPPDPTSAFSDYIVLGNSDFKSVKKIGEHARLADAIIVSTVNRAESLRARALAARHRSLVDNFCDQAKDEKAKSVVVQPERFISVELARGDKVAVVPTIGVPRADRYQEMETSIRKTSRDAERIWLLYDERGILETWLGHLDWLNDHLPVTSVQVSKCAAYLRGIIP